MSKSLADFLGWRKVCFFLIKILCIDSFFSKEINERGLFFWMLPHCKHFCEI